MGQDFLDRQNLVDQRLLIFVRVDIVRNRCILFKTLLRNSKVPDLDPDVDKDRI